MQMKKSSVALRVILSAFVLARAVASHKKYSASFYIRGGAHTHLNEFPFMAALGWIKNETGSVEYLGGGMLIAPNFILTAAHCIWYKGKLADKVLVGGNYLDNGPNEYHLVKKFFVYPKYDDKKAYHDIALLQLQDTSDRPPVCLWAKPTLLTRNTTAIGYGLTQFAGSGSTKLQKVNLVVFPENVCGPYFKRQRRFPSGILASHLCAGDPEGRRDTCQGDSGGPLMVQYEGQYYAAGVTSTGQACSGFPPAVYTRISSYIDWIDTIVKEAGYSIRKACDEDEDFHDE